MLKNTFTLFFLFACQLLFAQELITDSNVVLKKGVYRCFIEMKYNCPSLELNEKVVMSDLYDNYYKLSPRLGKSGIFGFCDGTNIYIRIAINIVGQDLFSKIEPLGRFGYVPYYSTRTSPGAFESGLGQSTTVYDPMFISFSTGNKYDLNKLRIEGLLQKDPELLDQYSNQSGKRKDEILKKYLRLHSEKHIEDILNYYTIESIEINNTERNQLYYFENGQDSSYYNYLKRIDSFENSPMYLEVNIDTNRYRSKQIKSIKIDIRDRFITSNVDQFHPFGTHIYYHKNGKIEKIIDYDTKGKKRGRNQVFDVQGNIVSDIRYIPQKNMPKK